MNRESKKFNFSVVLLSCLLLSLCLKPLAGYGEEAVSPLSRTLMKLEGEILDTEELKEPLGAAVFTVKDFSSGRTFRLFADPYRSLIQLAGSTVSAGDVTSGGKATIIYRKDPKREIPEIIFAKISGTYYA